MIRSSSASRLADRYDGRAQIALEPAAELRDQSDRVERQHRHQLPAVARPERRHDEHADRPLHPIHAAELLAGERQPAVGADPPAAQVDGVELIGVGEHPPRQIVRAIVLEPERAGERAPLVEVVRPDRRILELDRQPHVSAAQPLVELARRNGHRAPVEPRVAVGQRLPVDQRSDRRRRQAGGAHLPFAVPVQHRVGVRVAAAPHVLLVGVERLVLGQPLEGEGGQLLECPAPAREAPQQLPGRAGYTRAGLQPLALERAMVRLGEPTATTRGSPFRITDRGRRAGRERCVRHSSLLFGFFGEAQPPRTRCPHVRRCAVKRLPPLTTG